MSAQGLPPTAPQGVAPTVDSTRIGRLARLCYDRRKLVLVAWVVGFVVLNVLALGVKGVFNNKFTGGHSQAQLAQNLLTDKFPARAGTTADAVFLTTGAVTAPSSRADIDQIDQVLAHQPNVLAVKSPFAAGNQSQISRTDAHIAYSVIQFASLIPPKNDMVKLISVAKSLDRPGIEVQLGGQAIESGEPFSFGSAEGVGIFAAIIILLLAFGSLVAMGLPILIALFSLGAAVALIDLISHLVTVPTFATELAAMVGIGVGIDYALFIVTRYRQGLQDGSDPKDSIILSLATSGRSVLFAGSTVIISLFGMMLMGLSFVYGLAFAAIIAVVLVMAAALTLLPAILGLLGTNIDKVKIPHFRHKGAARETLSWRWSRVIQRHPWRAGVSALLALLVLSIPLFSMRLAFSDAGNDPTSFTTRHAYDLLAQGFGPGTNGPLVIAATLPSGAAGATLANVVDTLRGDSDSAFVSPPSYNHTPITAADAAVIVVEPKTSPQAAATQSFVLQVRRQVAQVVAGSGITAYVGGITAGGVDTSNQLAHRLFLVIGGVVLLSFLLLMAVFRSIAVPVKAAIMNLLSIGAAYGVIVAVFQWGWLGSFFGIGKVAPVDPWVPLMLFTILFGLSMDYEVFLLSRIREEWLKTHHNATAVADGLAETARVITAAAAIMVCVFGSFVLGDLRVLKLFGMGLAVAVFVDATLVRMVLVPATMELLGSANWWFPRWLDRAVPTLSVEVIPEAPERELAGAGVRD